MAVRNDYSTSEPGGGRLTTKFYSVDAAEHAAAINQLITDVAGKVTSGGALGTPSSGNLANCTFPTLNQNTTGSAATLTTARTFRTNLASTSTASFNGSANVTPGVTGTLPVGNGGTGATTLTGLVKGTGTTAFTAATAGTDYVAPGGALGTPSSGTLTNCTGLPVSGLGTGKVVGSNNGTSTSLTLWVGTAAQYAAIGTKDSATVYVVTP